jgi:nitroreductase / dihydropteridine reductase
MNLVESLNWRYATKRMNGKQVPQVKLDNILEAIRLSASGLGLQPYRVVVVENPELRAKIHETICLQPQVIEGSHLLVFASYTNLNVGHVDEYINRAAAEWNIPVEALSRLSNMGKGYIGSQNEEQNANWSARQVYIGLGFGLVAAAVEQVDATPMEGFDHLAMDEFLGLDAMNLQSVMVMALGFRDEETDYQAKAKKIRLPKEEFFITKA